MKRSLIILTILAISLAMIMASAPVQAVTNKVSLKIEGMT